MRKILKKLLTFILSLWLFSGFFPFFPMISHAQIAIGGGFSSVDACMAQPPCALALGGVIAEGAKGNATDLISADEAGIIVNNMSEEARKKAKEAAITAMCAINEKLCNESTGKANTNYYLGLSSISYGGRGQFIEKIKGSVPVYGPLKVTNINYKLNEQCFLHTKLVHFHCSS
jgi:hypothetical protein